jgi:hypothetical protein
MISIIHASATPTDIRLEGASEGFELLAAEAGSESKHRKFKMTAYTGAAISLPGFWSPVVVDLAGLVVPRQDQPILRQHDPERIVGHSTAIEVTAQRITIAGVISGVGQAAQEVIALADGGFPWQASIGASVQRMEYVEAGQTVKVNGRVFQGPLNVARQTTLRETSFVPIGADGGTSARVAANHPGGSTVNFEQWLQARGFDVASLTDAVKTSLRAMFDAEIAAANRPSANPHPSPAPTPPVDPLAEQRRVAAAEEERLAGIRAACQQFGNPNYETVINGTTTNTPLVSHAILTGWTVHETRNQAELIHLRASRPAPQVIVPSGLQASDSPKLIEAAILQAGGYGGLQTGGEAKLVKLYGDQVLQAAHDRYRGRIGLQQLLLEQAFANGYHGPMTTDGHERAVLKAAFSNTAIDGILSNVANKFLLAGYQFVEDSWRKIAARSSHKDFKGLTNYRMLGSFKFSKVGPDGMLRNGTVSEQSYTNKVETYGVLFSITRQQIINDDLGAITAVPREIGRGGALQLNEVVWTEFLDNAGFFTAGNKSLLTGAGSVLSSAGLTKAAELHAKQKDPSGNFTGSTPRLLLVPPALQTPAEELYVSTNLNTGGSSTETKVPNQNVHARKYEPVMSRYLSAGGLAGGSDTGWYLLSDPNDIPTIEVAFLMGNEVPTVESADADFSQLGVQMRGFWDFGAKKQEYRGGVKSLGA